MPKLIRSAQLLALLALLGCQASLRPHYSTTESALQLSRVVLYRNGIAYFERTGVTSGDRLALKVRKDQINDLLKSLTVVDRRSNKTLSISIPLDPQAWQDAALAMLMPGRGRLAEVLDALRGSEVMVDTGSRRVRGRIVMVEREALLARSGDKDSQSQPSEDHRLTLLDGDTLEIVQLSKVQALRFLEGDLVMQLDRHLDATAGEGMFQQVDVIVRFAEGGTHDLALSYVAPAPLWKPTYRLVLAEDGSGKALLQAWAVVSNVSGENWSDVQLALTSGAPLAFRYDLHTPQAVERPDLTQSGVDKHVQVSFGETSIAAPAPPPTAAAAPAPSLNLMEQEDDMVQGDELGSSRRDSKKTKGAAAPRKPAAPAIDLPLMAANRAPQATTKQVAGLTRFDIAERVSLPDGSASMVQLINQLVPGEQAFLYKPGGAGSGYELNPYRVVRFHNDSDFVLEPGPISIYAGGSFVGEGLSEVIASRDQATIPFAAEPSISVRSDTDSTGDTLKITKFVRGVIEVESFRRVTTHWSVEGKAGKAAQRVLVRQPRAAGGYTLVDPPKGTETLPDGYFIPIVLGSNESKATLDVVEQTPAKLSLDIWDAKVPELLHQLLSVPELSASARAALEPVVAARQELGRIDSELEGLHAQQDQLDERADQERENLLAIQKDPGAAALRKRLSQRLEELTQQAAEIGRKIVELNSRRMERKIELEDRLRDLNLDVVANQRMR